MMNEKKRHKLSTSGINFESDATCLYISFGKYVFIITVTSFIYGGSVK